MAAKVMLTAMMFLLLLVLVKATLSDYYGDSQTCPLVCQCSKNFTIVICRGKQLTSVPLGIPEQVKELYLDNNNLTRVERGAVANLTFLTKFYLRNNKIVSLEPYAFQNLPQLSELYMSNNLIAELHPDVFTELGALTLINLDGNRLTLIPDLRHLCLLKTLSLEANRIENATFPACFRNLTALERVVLSNNRITQLTNYTFATTISIRALEVTRNQINDVSPGALMPLRMLTSLRIGYNPLGVQQLQNALEGIHNDATLASLDISNVQLNGTFPTGPFSLLSTRQLSSLMFTNNVMHTIPRHAFVNLPKLVHLDLSACQVQTIDDTVFQDLTVLQELFLNDNLQLESVPRNLSSTLKTLHLQGNNIQVLQNHDFAQLKNLRELFLSQNKMHQLGEKSLNGLSSLQTLHLADNKLSYLPKNFFASLKNLTALNLKNNNLRTLKNSPGALSSLTALTSLDLSNNQCSFIPEDYLHDLEKLQILNLDNNYLKGLFNIDHNGTFLANMKNLQTLNIRNNYLESISDAQFRNLSVLQHLDLANNHLSSWGPDLFKTAGSSLRSLDLSNNLVALVNETSVRDLTQLQMFNLSLNPFACTCDLRWFRSWLDNTTVGIANKETYTCNSPPAWNGKLLLTFGPDKIDCKNRLLYYIIGACTSCFIIAVVLGIIIHRYRWFIKLRCYRLGKVFWRDGQASRNGYAPISGEPDKIYDFYIVCCEEDHKWLREKLLPCLEKDPRDETRVPFQVYFEERDAAPNKVRVGIFDDDILKCDAALVILTKHLGEDDWCELVLEQVVERIFRKKLHHIEIIQVGPIQSCHIPKRLQKFLERGDYITWPNCDEVQQAFAEYLQNTLCKKFN